MIKQSLSLRRFNITPTKKPAHGYLYLYSRSWKQPRYPSIDEWINKLWYIHTMEYYSMVKKKGNEPSIHKQTWKKLKYPLLRERSQSEKDTYYIIQTIQHSGKGKTMEIMKR